MFSVSEPRLSYRVVKRGAGAKEGRDLFIEEMFQACDGNVNFR